MSVEVRGDFENLMSAGQASSAAKGNKEAWTNRLRECMDDDYTVRTQVLAAYTKRGEYIPGSYNEDPIVPPIINPPPAVTQRGPNAPYYDAKLTGGPLLRPDARVYTYDTCPSYMRAIIDWSYGRPAGAKNYPKDAEYTKVFYDLCNGNGYKGAFAMDPDPDFVWKPDISTRVLGAYTNESHVLGAYTVNPNALQRTFEDVEAERRYQATAYESALFDSVKDMLDAHPDQEAIVIDGEVIMLPKNRQQPAMTQPAAQAVQSSAQAYLSTAALLRQMRLDSASESEEAYRQRLAELGLDTAVSI